MDYEHSLSSFTYKSSTGLDFRATLIYKLHIYFSAYDISSNMDLGLMNVKYKMILELKQPELAILSPLWIDFYENQLKLST